MTCKPGMTKGSKTVEEITDGYGQHFWKVSIELESLFGSEVYGGVSAYGPSEEIASERAEKKMEDLYETIWI